MDGQALVSCLMAFCCVVVTYIVADSAVRVPKIDDVSFPMRAALPAALRRWFPVMVWGAELFGYRLEKLRPARAETLRKQLLLVNLPLSPGMVFGAQCALVAGGVMAALVVFALSGNAKAAFFLGGLFAFCGWFFPPTALESAAEKRRSEIIKGLPFAIDLIGSAMHAGLDFNAAVRYYCGLGLKTPVAEEFGVMLREAELGKSRVEALQAMALRVQTQAFTSFVDAVAHGIEVGASLVGTMRMQGEDMRRARFHLAEEKAARAPSIMILPMAVFIMPAVFVIVFVPVIMRYKAARGG